MNDINTATVVAGPSRSRGPLRALIDLFSSVWLGITLLSLLFVYSSLGSAVPPLRQHWLIEKTEFEFFHWWPFDLLIGLLVTNLVVTTVRKIPFNVLNLGVWTIHTGIITLILGSVYYFGTKVEGDAPIYRRRVVIQVPGQADPVHMLVRPGNRLEVGSGEDGYTFRIANIQPEYGLRTEGHEGERTYAVQLMVQTPTQTFIRQLLAGYPQFTEDVIPGKGRAIKETGKALVDDQLDIRLEYEPQTHFFIMDTAALYVRPMGTDRWAERPIPGLPRYHERISSRSEVWMPHGEPVPIRPMNIEVSPSVGAPDALADYDVQVTGYLRYAFQHRRWVAGGDRLNPVCGFTLRFGEIETRNYELVAFDGRDGQAEDGRIDFRWIDSLDELDALASVSEPTLTIRIPEHDVEIEVPAIAATADEADEPFQAIEGTGYAYRIRSVVNHLNVPSGRLAGQTISVAIVEIRQGERRFTRWVADLADATRDISPDSHEAIETDLGIEMSYEPGSVTRLTLAAGPEPIGLHVLYRDGDERSVHRGIKPGDELILGEGLAMRVSYLYPHARTEQRPEIVPLHERDRDAGKAFSMIKVELSKDGWSTSQWLPYNHYALAGEQYAITGRISYQPRTVSLGDGTNVELLFSREQHELPSPVVLDSFTLETYQGGLSGANGNVRDYVSVLRFADGAGGWSDPVQMKSNMPAADKGFWFFQSTWDPPRGESAGMNYTGAGVGNRNGVYIQLLGCCVAVTGMIYAFYVKPIIKRRRQQKVWSQVARRDEAGEDIAAQVTVPETVGQV